MTDAQSNEGPRSEQAELFNTPKPYPSHFLLELHDDAEDKADKLRTAMIKLTAIERRYNKLLLKAGREEASDLENVNAVRSLLSVRDGLEESLEIDRLYDELKEAQDRFEKASRAYEIGDKFQLEKAIGFNLRKTLLDEPGVTGLPSKTRKAVGRLARAIKKYLTSDPSDDNDKQVREAWQDIEPYITTRH